VERGVIDLRTANAALSFAVFHILFRLLMCAAILLPAGAQAAMRPVGGAGGASVSYLKLTVNKSKTLKL
jgi:hypothetical protein